jgi:DNA-3-methyladenine glycosylase II
MPNDITLNEQSEAIQYLCKKDKRLAKVISMVGPITYETHDEPFAFLIHEIIEQMLSIKAGAKIYGRLEELCNGSITPKNISLLSDEQIKSIGISYLRYFIFVVWQLRSI